MRKITSALIAVLVLPVASCAGSAQPVASTPPTQSVSTDAPVATANRAFITDLRAEVPEGILANDVTLVGYGHEICSDLDAGWTTTMIGPLGLEPASAAQLYRAAATHLCPQHLDDI